MATRCEVCGQYPIQGTIRTFFPWPADISQRAYWQTCLGIQDLDLSKPELFICSDHFDQLQMIRKGSTLRKDAFPKRYEGPLPTFPQGGEVPPEPPKMEPSLETPCPDVKNEDGIFGTSGPPAPLFDDEEIMPEELSMAKLLLLFTAAAKERPSGITPLVTPVAEETKAFSNILIDRQQKYLDSYCKSCLRQAELVNMMEANCEGVPVLLMYKSVFMTELDLSEIPQLMCHTCIGLLFQCFKFTTMTLRSCEVLRAARERFKYLPPLDDSDIDLKNIPEKYSATPAPIAAVIESDEDDKQEVKKVVRKRKATMKVKLSAPPKKKGRPARRASVKSKKVNKKILDSDVSSSESENFDNDEADPDFEDAAAIKDESPESSDVEPELEEKEEPEDEGDEEKVEEDENYCMLCRHKFSNMARHMDKVHRVDWENKSCERENDTKLKYSRVGKKSTKREKIKADKRKAETTPTKKDGIRRKSAYPCLKCDITFKTFKKVFEHYKSEHKDVLDCIFCGKMFDNDIQLLDHFAEHGQRNYCRVHFIPFDTMAEWLKHVKQPTHHLQCGICDKSFKSRSGRDNHRIYTHLKPSQEIQCPLCPLTYGSGNNLRRHIRRVHEKRFFLCEDCGASFATNYSLGHHIAQKHQKYLPAVSPKQCEDCGKIFSCPRNLKRHKAKHDGKSEICQFCGKFFENEELLKQHVESFNHHLFQCSICSTTFKVRAYFVTHLVKSHNIPKPEAVHISSERKGYKMFKKQRMWKKGTKRARRRRANPNARKGRPRGTTRADVKYIDGKKHFCCLLCDKMFTNDSNLARHKELHSDVRYKCSLCNKSFAQKQGLQKHMPVHSDERPFECKICGKRYKDSCTLGKHKRVHGKSSLIGVNSGSLSPRRKKPSQPKPILLDRDSQSYENPPFYLSNAIIPQNYVIAEQNTEVF